MSILECRSLSKSFGGLAAVKEVDFSLEKGEILGVIGPNGAGKTTLFNLIAGVYRPTSGVVRFNGREITGMPPYAVCRLGIAKASQIMEPFPDMSVFENVLVGALFGGELGFSRARSRAEEVLDFVGLSDWRDRPAGRLFVGARRRLELARALATGARVLLLDETMAGLNPSEQEEAVKLIQSIRESGCSLVVVEHNMPAILGVSDRIMVLNYGVKIAEGPPGDVVCRREVVRAYLGARSRARRWDREHG